MSSTGKPATADGATPTIPATRRSLKKYAIMLVGGVVMGGAGLGAFQHFKASGAEGETGKDEKHSESKTDATQDKPKRGKIVTLNPIVVNLRGTAGTRYLKAAIALETQNQEVVDELKDMNAQLVDYLREHLASARVEDLDTAEGRNRLKRELLQGTNDMLNGGCISSLYFSEFVIQ